MRHSLVRHPDTPCDAVTEILVDLERPRPDRLRLSYHLRGRIAGLRLPDPAAPTRTDELWRHTCLEAFVRAGGQAYLEFNLSPSGQWAAYAFDGYRAGMRDFAPMDDPGIVTAQDDGALVLTATTPAPPSALALGLCAVIEEADGRKSYWALRHPEGKPDFHHPDCFALEIPAPLVP